MGNEQTLCIFDIDETIVTHEHQHVINVYDKHNRFVVSLTTDQYNHYVLDDGNWFDYSQFDSAELFARSAKPIKRIIDKINDFQTHGYDVHIVTARRRIDNYKHFIQTLKKFNVICDQYVPIVFSGSLPAETTPLRKRLAFKQLLEAKQYLDCHLFDDNAQMIEQLFSLAQLFPNTNFHGHLVNINNDGVSINRSTINAK